MDLWSFRPPVLVGERVVWLGSGTGLPQGGVVRWIGKLPEMGPDWTVGLKLDNPLPYGGIDGSWGNRHLFTCEPKHGLIVPITKIVREADLLKWPFSTLAAAAEAATACRGSEDFPSALRPRPPARSRPPRALEPDITTITTTHTAPPSTTSSSSSPPPPPQPPQPPARKPVSGRQGPRPAVRRRKRLLPDSSILGVIPEPPSPPPSPPSPAASPSPQAVAADAAEPPSLDVGLFCSGPPRLEAAARPSFLTYPERRRPTARGIKWVAVSSSSHPPPAAAAAEEKEGEGRDENEVSVEAGEAGAEAGTLLSRKDRGSSLRSVLSGRTFVTCASGGEYSDYSKWFDADESESVYDFFDCDSDAYEVVLKGDGGMSRGQSATSEEEPDSSLLDSSSPEEDSFALERHVVRQRRALPSNTISAAAASNTSSASRREKTSSGFFSFFRWFRKGRGDDAEEEEEAEAAQRTKATRGEECDDVVLPPTPSSVRLVRTQSSSCGSIDTLFSTATVSSFAFVTPAVYRPYSPAIAPEKWIASGPETDTYRHRVLEREKTREQDRGLTLRRKYHLFGSDTQLRQGLSSPEASPRLGVPSPPPAPPPPSSPTSSSNSTFGRKKRRAPLPPPVAAYNDYSLPSSWRKEKEATDPEDEGNGVKKKRHRRAASESAKDRRAGAYCHVKGKRRAPLPPGALQQEQQLQRENAGSLDRFRARVASFGRKKRPAPPPPAAANASPSEPQVTPRRPKKDQETQAAAEESCNSISKLSPEDRERLIDNIAKLKAHANRKSMGSPPIARKDFYVDVDPEPVVCNDSLKLERGVLKPNKDMPKVEASASTDGKTAPVSPRPWYKRSLSSSKEKESGGGLRRDIFKSLEKRKEREREEEWMPEAGVPPRGAAGVPPPSDGASVSSTASSASTSSATRFNFFSRLEEKRGGGGGEKRRSQLSMLANISELDREAAEIVQKEQAREQALAAAHDAKFYSFSQTTLSLDAPPADTPPSSMPPSQSTAADDVDEPKRSSAKELISLFNAIGNVTKVTVNTSFFTREGSGFFSREGSEKRNGEEVTVTPAPTSPQVRRKTQDPKVMDKEEGRDEEEEDEEEVEDGINEGGGRTRALYEAGRTRRHHSPSPSIPTIAEQSESTTPASTLDAGSKRSSILDGPAVNAVPTSSGVPAANAPVPGIDNGLQQPSKRSLIWTCPRCTLENPRWRITCEACGRWKPPDAKEEPQSSPPVVSSAPSIPTPSSTPVTVSSLLAAPAAPTSSQSNGFSQKENHKTEAKGAIDWEEELKHYFPRGGNTSQTKTQTSSTPVENGVKDTQLSSKSEKSVASVSEKKVLAMPSTFIGGRTKADEQRQGAAAIAKTSVTPPTAAPPSSNAPSSPPAQKADVDEVRKARLAFFIRSDSADEAPKKPSSPKRRNSDGKDKQKAKGEAIYAGLKLPSDEKEKKKLKEMLKEMKDSLPRYPKNFLTNGNDVPKTNGVASPKTSGEDGYKRGAIKKVPLSGSSSTTMHNGTDHKVEAVFVTSKTIIEETKVRKVCGGGGAAATKLPKVSTSCQTSSVVRKVDPPSSSSKASASSSPSAALPVTVEEMWEESATDGAGGGVSRSSSFRSFELIRARDFATIEASKTSAGKGGGAMTHVYANVPASHHKGLVCATAAAAPQPVSPTPQQLHQHPQPQPPPPPPQSLHSNRDAPLSSSMGSDAATTATSSSPPDSPLPEAASSCSVASDSSEVERLTAQLTLPKGLADFKADLQAQPVEHNVNTLAVNRLLRRLEAAIAGGQHHQAAVLARDLARLKISCSVTRQRRSVTASPASITVDMYVEDKVSHQGPIPLQVTPDMTVSELKQKVEEEFEIPVGVQRWILGKMLASDDDKTLEDHHVNTSGCPMFLYLVAPDGDQDGDGVQIQAETEVPPAEAPRIPSPVPPSLPPPPPVPAEKAGGWFYNHEDDRYSFCEDTESEMATDDEGDDERSEQGPAKITLTPPNLNILTNGLEKDRRIELEGQEDEDEEEDEDDDDEDEDEFGEKPILVSPSAVIIHDRPVIIEAPAAVVDQRKDVLPTASAVQPASHADVGTMKLGWKCPVCTLMNSPTRPGCAACTTERPMKYVVPVEYKASPHEVERIRKEVQGDQDLLKAEAKAKEVNDQNEHYQELVNLDNTDLVPNTDPFECSICFTPYGRHEGVILRDCLHTFCKPCLANTVQFNEEAEVKCPYRDHDYACDSVLQEREIKALVPKKMYEQHLAKSVAQAENKIGNAFHCKTPDCRGWCIFEDNVNEFRCPVCRVINCLTCQAIHDGINCKQYQEQVQQQSETNAEARRTKEMLEEMVVRGEAMACPTCQVVLMKKWGCDWLRCSMCKTEICWVTRGPRWGPGGKGDTTGGCQCGVNGVKCHPRCNYCH